MTNSISQKEEAELAFWQSRLKLQGVLSNDHYEYFYTTHFGLAKEYYSGKKILDIGCGPRGSLEWADVSEFRIGVDPLAFAYRNLGSRLHAMKYVACVAETLPFATGSFDIVCSLNSLDHVDDLNRVKNEIIRVISPGGIFLLITDIHRLPTILEPSAYLWDIVDQFLPAFELVEKREIEITVFSPEGFGDIYQSLKQDTQFNHNNTLERNGGLSAMFRKCA